MTNSYLKFIVIWLDDRTLKWTRVIRSDFIDRFSRLADLKSSYASFNMHFAINFFACLNFSKHHRVILLLLDDTFFTLWCLFFPQASSIFINSTLLLLNYIIQILVTACPFMVRSLLTSLSEVFKTLSGSRLSFNELKTRITCGNFTLFTGKK
jgi:hypothetical protein